MASWMPRTVASLALVASGALTFAAAYERWWPACPRGDLDASACVRLQSHEFDYLVPTAPWQPIGQDAEYAGLALLALALAAVVLPFVLGGAAPRGPWRIFELVLAVVPAGALAVLGVATLRAGLTGEPTSAPAVMGLAFLVWAVAWPAALTAYAVFAPRHAGRRRAVAVAVLLALSTPVPVLLLLGPIAAGYTSYDTVPWTEATAAPFLLVAAALVAWPATTRLRRPSLVSVRPTPSPGSPGGPRRPFGHSGGVGSAHP
jgi:hypothetical protein